MPKKARLSDVHSADAPPWVAELLSVFKEYAGAYKGLERDIKHAEALERLAKAIGYPNYHAFTQVVAACTTFENLSNATGSQFGGLMPLTTFLPRSTPTADSLHHLTAMAAAVGEAFELEEPHAKAIVAQINGQRTWPQLESAATGAPGSPLSTRAKAVANFGLWVSEGTGTFLAPGDCEWRLNNLIHEYDELPDDELVDHFKHVARHCRKWPGHLRALVFAADVRTITAGPAEALPVYERAVERALYLVAKEKPSCIPEKENKFFYEALHAVIVDGIMSDDESEVMHAVERARLSVRLNDRDGAGLRFVMPIMEVAVGAKVRASRSCAELGDDGEAEQFAKGVVSLASAKSLASRAAIDGVIRIVTAMYLTPPFANYVLHGVPLRDSGGEYPYPLAINTVAELQWDIVEKHCPVVAAVTVKLYSDERIRKGLAEMAHIRIAKDRNFRQRAHELATLAVDERVMAMIQA